MKSWLKENWLKLGGLVCALVLASSVGYYYIIFLPHIEQQKADLAQDKFNQEKIAEEAKMSAQAQKDEIDAMAKQAEVEAKNLGEQRKARVQSSIDKCITDAYAELKTLQSNYEVGGLDFCYYSLKAGNSCSDINATTEKEKKEAYNEYVNEWVPQCKLGNRVFPHYETMVRSPK